MLIIQAMGLERKIVAYKVLLPNKVLLPSSTIFQSYQDAGRLKMKGCVQWNPDYD